VVAIPVDDVRTTPLASARRAWKGLAAFLLLGFLSFAGVADVAAVPPDLDHSDKGCGPLRFDFTDPCNAILMAVH
jgi:hypothetical protein